MATRNHARDFEGSLLRKNLESSVAQRLQSVPADPALAGTWITDDEDSDAAFVISISKGKFQVNGFCRSDGERFEITQVKWDGRALSFVARMPSTDAITGNTFRLRPDGRADFELTTFEVWKKKPVEPGDIAETWRAVHKQPNAHSHVRRNRLARR